jgi:outer membrane protein assembly factor BamB
VKLRSVPVALLTSLLVAAVLARLTRHPRPHDAAQTHGTTMTTRDAGAWLVSAAGQGHVPPLRMQHGDRRRTGRSAARGPVELSQGWKAEGLGPIEAQVIPSLDESTLYVATLGGNLVALSRQDGTVRFTIPLGGRSYASPCVDDRGNVYVGSDAKKVLAVSPEGHVVWTLDLDDEADTACAITDDMKIVLAAGRTLYAVSQTGDVLWRFAAHRKIFTAPAVDDRGRVIVGSQDHHVYAVEAGRKVWAVDLGADVDGSPAIDDDGSVVVGTDGGDVVRLSADGGVLWTAHVGGFVRGALSIARGGDVLVGVYGPRARVVRLDGQTGAEKASFDVPGTGALEMGVHGGPTEDADGKLYFGAQDDRVYALGRDRKVATFRCEADVDAPVTLLSDGALVVASDDGAVYYLRP